MATTPSDEILLKLAVDLSAAKIEFQDLSKIISDRNKDIEEAEKKIRSYGDTAVKEAEKVNKAFKKNIDSIKEEVELIQKLENITQKLSRKNAKLFDTKNVEEFNEKVEELYNPLGGNSPFFAPKQGFIPKAPELDQLSKDLNSTKDDIEATIKVVEFFEQKLKDAGDSGSVSMAQIKHEINDIKDFIYQTEREIKGLDNQIESAAPGKLQAGLIQEREKLNQSIEEAKLNLEGLNQEYKTLQSESSKAAKSQTTLQTELRKVKEEMVRLEVEGEANSQQYEELSQKATKYQKSIQDVNKEIKHSTSNTAGLQNVIGLVNGLVGIYATAQGAAALFGNESQELEQTIQKLGGALAILNGLQATQAELANKTGLAHKAIAFIQRQYAVATDASAKATLRLGAALKLLGIGLLVGALAAAVVYWKDIAKWMGITSDEAERNAEITSRSNEIYGEQIAQLTLLNKRIKEGSLSFKQKEAAVKEFNETFGKTLGSVKDYIELENRLIANGDTYIKYLGLKAKAEAAYQLAIESQKTALEEQNNLINKAYSGLDKLALKAEGYVNNSLLGKNVKTDVTQNDISRLLGIPDEKQLRAFLNEFAPSLQDNLNKIWKNRGNSDSFLDVFGDASLQAEELANQYNIVGDAAEKTSKRASKSTKDWTSEIKKLINELVKLQKTYAIALMGNERDQEKAILEQQVKDEAKAYAEQINALGVSNEKKLQLIEEYNRLYNEKTGLAYQLLREQLEEIDREYEERAREANLNAIMAINEVYNRSDENEILAIREKWKKLREEWRTQRQLAEDEATLNDLNARLAESVDAEQRELTNEQLRQSFERVKREKEIADQYVKLWQAANGQIVENDKIAKQMLLANELSLQNALLDEIRKANPEKAELLNESFQTLITSDVISDYETAGEVLKKAFGEELYQQILSIAAAIREINKETNNLTTSEKGNISNWFKDTKSFATELGTALGLEGEDLEKFAETLSYTIQTVWGTMNQVMAQNVADHQAKLAQIESMIAQTESQLERERDLYEQGYANNYELRKLELEQLKKQKEEQAEVLEKAKRQQLIAQTAMQISSLATAVANIFDGTTKINPIVGVALGAALAATLLSAFMAFKSQAQQAAAPSYRTGLEAGALMLNGPSHERGGMGLYDSSSGRKVAEYEGGEQLFALNKGQQSKYGWLMQMMIDDAKGNRPVMDSLISKIPVTGKKTIRKVREVNEISRSAHQKRAEASNEYREMLGEVKKLNKRFNEEMSGFKNREEEKTETWETTHYIFVKKNGVTKKYKKKPDNE